MNTPLPLTAKNSLRYCWVLLYLVLAPQACGDPLGKDALTQLESGGQGKESSDRELRSELCELSSEIEWTAEDSVYLNLSSKQITEPGEDNWDLKFRGDQIFTNSGPNGDGSGGAFGPLDAEECETDKVPVVPFLRADSSGSALTDWYKYDSSTHTLSSKHHVYGIRNGKKYFKLQILSYYSEVQGAPVSALVRLRYAPLTQDGPGDTVELTVDATAGAPDVSDDQPSGCLDLKNDQELMLTVAEAAERTDWDLCLRRDQIFTNGGVGGPGNVRAVDLNHGEDLSLEELTAHTESDWEARFDAVDYEMVTSAGPYVRDGLRSGFTDRWLGEDSEDGLTEGSWLVRGYDGESMFIVLLANLEHRGEERHLKVLSRKLTDRAK